jgi:phosphatidylglycerol:prolipoprotein diacylglycerol transferase
VVYQAPKNEVEATLQHSLAALFGALLGGRLVYVAVNWPYYQEQALEIPQVWLGGFSGLGALGGALLALRLAAWRSRQPWGKAADALLPLLAAVTVVAWLACWSAGCAYGNPTEAWWGVPARNEWGVTAFRQPAQLWGACAALVLYWAINRSRKWLTAPGGATYLALFGLALLGVGLSFLRADPAPIWRGLRLDAWGWLGLAGFAFLLGLTTIKPRQAG